MILSDTEISQELNRGTLKIIPFEQGMLQPASYDLRVGQDAATIPKNGDPLIDLKKEGFMLIAPYAPAVIWTMEHLTLPLNVVGRFGLKSSLSRRGIYASVGPQVDPGFRGKLSVTMLNLTPVPVALNYGEDFLSLELHRMAVPASRPYSGEYQGRETFTAKEIEPILGYKGHALSEVVKGFGEIQGAIENVASLSAKFDSFLQNYQQQNQQLTEFNRALLTEMKKLVEHIANDRPHTVVLRAIPRKQAKDEILKLFKDSSKPLFYSDVAEQLNLDLELVVELCSELEKQNQIGVLSRYEAKRPKTKRK